MSAASQVAPATQVSEPSNTGPTLNELGEILTSFPPKCTEMGVLKLQGTVIEKSTGVRRLIGSTTGARTGVGTIAIFGCRPGTVNVKRSIEPFDTIGIANNQTGSSVKNRFGQSNSFHRTSFNGDSDLIEGCLPKSLSRRCTH